MFADLKRTQEEMSKRYIKSARHTIQVDFNLYVRDLHAEIRAGEKRAKRIKVAA